MTKISINKGFTLIELTIVVVIIGILIGGVLQAQELIQQARIRAQISQIQDFEKANNTFYLTYSNLPGDFSKASTLISPSAEDGNGDSKLEYGDNEVFSYWNHLTLAGMLKGKYVLGNPGFTTSGYTPVKPGLTVPAGKIRDICIESVYLPRYSSPDPYTLSYIENLYLIGSFWPQDGDCAAGGFTPEEASSIDSKMDDGIPNGGKLIGLTGYEPAEETFYSTYCVTTVNGLPVYNITQTGHLCLFNYLFSR